LIKKEVERFRGKASNASLPEIQETVLKEFPNDYISVGSVREIAMTAAKIRDIGTGEIIDYYDLIWGKVSKYTYEDAVDIARVRSLEKSGVPGSLVTLKHVFDVLTENTSPTKVVLTWSCNKKGHKYWPARFDMIIDGHWCLECYIERVRQIYDDFIELARRRGVEENNRPGTLVMTHVEFEELIESIYTPPSKAILKWGCNIKGHKTWDARPNSIQQGRWCLYCSEGKYESIYRKNIESSFSTQHY